MKNELKSAIRFNDFVAYFGARDLLAMAWWMGAVHAGRIREDQTSPHSENPALGAAKERKPLEESDKAQKNVIIRPSHLPSTSIYGDGAHKAR